MIPTVAALVAATALLTLGAALATGQYPQMRWLELGGILLLAGLALGRALAKPAAHRESAANGPVGAALDSPDDGEHSGGTHPPSLPDAPEQEVQRLRRSLDLLHGVLTRLLEEPESTEPFNLLLKEIEDMTGASASALFEYPEGSDQPLLLASTGNDEETLWRQRLDALRPRLLAAPEAPVVGAGFSALTLDSRDPGAGVILLRCGDDLGRCQPQRLSQQCERLAGILQSAHRAQLKLRMAQYEERVVIARELHDSLAQYLSYLKIQASRLQALLEQDSGRLPMHNAEVDTILQELRGNLNVAYRQLRDLITTFRLTMHGRSLGQAVEESVEEFEKRSAIAFDLDNRLTPGELTVAEEMQVLHIVREAVSNVVRHSHAKYAQVSLHSSPEGRVRITVVDDGIGISPNRRREQHHGLIIMQERAHSLGGSIKVDQAPGGGTRVQVQFHPRNQAAAQRRHTGT